jgi:small subunit ribosomal protein S20
MEEDLANIKSQIKRNKQNDAARKRNRVYRGTARTMIRKALVSLKSGKQEESKAEVMTAIKALDHAATKGVLHKNNAARRKSRLMARFNALKD